MSGAIRYGHPHPRKATDPKQVARIAVKLGIKPK
jgi:hypothetical protein